MKQTLTTTGCSAAVLLVFSLTVEGQAALSASGANPCADPAADIELALISKSGPTAGRVRITGIVKNLGNAAWTATSMSHRLQMVLARRNSEAQPEGEPIQPAIAIQQLAPGQQYRIDYQTNWDTDKKDSHSGFIVRFFELGLVGTRPASSRPDCRSDNNRKEIAAADIDRLFQPAAPEKPLKAQSYRLLGGVGVNTVETQFAYSRSSVNAGKLTASVAAPYTGTSDEVPINGSSGTAIIRVHIPCDVKETSDPNAQPVTIIYRLWASLSLPGGSGWVPSFSLDQSIPYSALCGPDATGNTN
jgi:hypothetical protein